MTTNIIILWGNAVTYTGLWFMGGIASGYTRHLHRIARHITGIHIHYSYSFCSKGLKSDGKLSKLSKLKLEWSWYLESAEFASFDKRRGLNCLGAVGPRVPKEGAQGCFRRTLLLASTVPLL